MREEDKRLKGIKGIKIGVIDIYQNEITFSIKVNLLLR
jgi:hypothetical protein